MRSISPLMQGLDLPHKTYVNICGTDIIRDEKGEFLVLEDNARTPSGVSYVIENRHMMLRSFSDLMDGIGVRPIDDYGQNLARALRETAPPDIDDPRVVLLSPGTYNSAYFEHVFLAREMGVPLVEGRDLDRQRTTRSICGRLAAWRGWTSIYRRIGDDFLDPEAFNPESMLGVPGLMRAYKAGRVSLANAVGTGVADDKAVYAYMPRVIRYYLDEDADPAERARPSSAASPKACSYTLDHLDELVVKPVAESGGYGIMIGPKASRGRTGGMPGQADRRTRPTTSASPPSSSRSRRPSWRARSAPPRRSAPVRDHRREDLGAAGRPHAGRAPQGLARRQLVPRGRIEGYLGS